MNFSVLISVYIRETSANLNRALTSIWDDQYLKPNQIVIVKDGPLKKDLNITIEKWKNRLNEIICFLDVTDVGVIPTAKTKPAMGCEEIWRGKIKCWLPLPA